MKGGSEKKKKVRLSEGEMKVSTSKKLEKI